jgi:soluble lytic murein transglycosylase-like protein
MTDAIRAHVARTAPISGLPVGVVLALIEQESTGNPWAYRPEPRYRYFVNVKTKRPFRDLSPDEIASKIAPPDFPYLAGSRNQEWWGQQASFGLTQIMGAVAREQGFDGPYLTALCDPVTNIEMCCRILASALRWSGGNVRLALGSYNAGRGGASSAVGRAYAEKVLARVDDGSRYV